MSHPHSSCIEISTNLSGQGQLLTWQLQLLLLPSPVLTCEISCCAPHATQLPISNSTDILENGL